MVGLRPFNVKIVNTVKYNYLQINLFPYGALGLKLLTTIKANVQNIMAQLKYRFQLARSGNKSYSNLFLSNSFVRNNI